MKRKTILCLLLSFFVSFNLIAAKPKLDRVEPMFWWAGMHNPHLQLMVHGQDIALTQVSINYPGVEVKGVTQLDSKNYIFIDLNISKDAKAGVFDILFKQKNKVIAKYAYELRSREAGSAMREGFNTKDALYLIMPDRFANGDTSNDNIKVMRENLNRENSLGRHGGDIAGIVKNLDYIIDQGYTAIWLNPVIENDMPANSYHGYAVTDFYQIDRHYGSNEDYRAFAKDAKDKNIKLIMDMIFNHCGALHWWMKDLPSNDWINNMPEGVDMGKIEYTDEAMNKMDKSAFTITTHRKTVIQDPHVAKGDQDHMVDGWFVPSMPDLNQKNPYVARYLIQNSIWWIEYAHLAGIRMDTYPYPDKNMMAQWNKEVLEAYPNFTIVGEEMFFDPSIVSYWEGNEANKDGYIPYTPSMMDFPLQGALCKGFTEEEGWENGLMRIYLTLAKDFLYSNPYNLVTFPDNHDLSRYYSVLNKDLDLWKMGIATVLTTRGIPQIFYGTETLMEGFAHDGHGKMRADFPGGWSGDKVNAFTGEGLNKDQKDAQKYIRTLLKWRKGSKAITEGKLIHFIPENGIYLYSRYTNSERVVVILNKNEEAKDVDPLRYEQVLKGFTKGHSVLDNKEVDVTTPIHIDGKSVIILELH
ncbi:glycoside hydrolase family 13 protein [Halosquirtibacter xylanolyticus]|uniref:glycoside hydrolase family 13 protein n=1 Tax=Halosquirtibacter xylanolyticus TaxID=3374599 RepID=UPI0037480E40|nr:glycoside hydrolase family 13 protein [Prolixibacteraceae bacterium]